MLYVVLYINILYINIVLYCIFYFIYVVLYFIAQVVVGTLGGNEDVATRVNNFKNIHMSQNILTNALLPSR